jgi:hypothetical protein
MRHLDLEVLFEKTEPAFEYELQEVAMAPYMERRYMVHPKDTKLGKKEVLFSYLEMVNAIDLKKAMHQKVLDAYGL